MSCDDSMPRLLLHICCGPCATTVIERLSSEYELTGFFYNPNIYPEEEYIRRLEAAREVTKHLGIPLLEGAYESEMFFDTVRGLENEPENGARCPSCYRLRLESTARTAADGSFGIIATTLTVGPMKRAAVINPIGHEEAERYGVSFLDGDWKKRNGFRKSCEMSRQYGIYRQHYCGCLFSMKKDDKIL